MKHNKRAPPLALLGALVLLLATLGVGYTMWSETLTIGGTVRTGSVDGVWYYASCNENDHGKSVGSWTIAPDPNDQSTLVFTIVNGYPSYRVDCQVHWANSGTVPVIIQSVTTDIPNPTAISASLRDGVGAQVEPCGFTPAWGTDPLRVPEQCEEASSLIVHVEQAALENTSYTFESKVCIRQWNEVGSCPP